MTADAPTQTFVFEITLRGVVGGHSMGEMLNEMRAATVSHFLDPDYAAEVHVQIVKISLETQT